MFRAAFHTGYVPSGVLRLTKQQLDGACADDRFHQARDRKMDIEGDESDMNDLGLLLGMR